MFEKGNRLKGLSLVNLPRKGLQIWGKACPQAQLAINTLVFLSLPPAVKGEKNPGLDTLRNLRACDPAGI